MSRKYVYGLLALPVVVALVALAITPEETRATFFTEFKHRTRLMMGFEPDAYVDDDLGPSSEDMGISEQDLDDDKLITPEPTDSFDAAETPSGEAAASRSQQEDNRDSRDESAEAELPSKD